jgi:putative oxidoreductase
MSTSTAPRTAGVALGTARDLALLVARIGLGVLMIGHAWLEFDFGGRSVVGVGQIRWSCTPTTSPRTTRCSTGRT